MAVAKKKQTFKSMLEDQAVPESSTPKKSKSVSKLIADASLAPIVDAYLVEKKKKADAEAGMKTSGNVLIERITTEQDTEGFEGYHHKSFDVPGKKDNRVKVVTADKFSINAEDEGEIKKLLGKKGYEANIEETYNISLKPEVLEDEKLQAELMELIGPENFARFFSTTKKLSTVKGFDARVYQAISEDKLPELRTFIKPTKPSIK